MKNQDGSTFDLGYKDAREGALKIYSPEGGYNLCFCQMCCKVKDKHYIIVNNIEYLPEYYFTQLRIALCMECSKQFESLRNNEFIRKEFIQNIIDYNIYDESTVNIPIGSFDTIKFTAKHLAEIQEILKQKPKKNK